MSPTLERIHTYIYAIDFSLIIEKMVNVDGWRRSDALATSQLYRNFLYLNKKYSNDRLLPPSEDVDEFWHYHILDTKQYVADCEVIFGHYLHHYPYLVLDHQLTTTGLDQAFELTQQLHQSEFGTSIYATRSRYPNWLYCFLKRFSS